LYADAGRMESEGRADVATLSAVIPDGERERADPGSKYPGL